MTRVPKPDLIMTCPVCGRERVAVTILDHLEAAYALTPDPRSLPHGSQERRNWIDAQEAIKRLHIKVKRMTEARK
jgi:hypothetical protein